VTGIQRIAKGRQTQARDVHCLVAVIRLPHVQSDLLITLSTPTSSAAGSQAGTFNPAGTALLFRNVLETLSIKDYSLFGA
jgi:hypothetical protein